jgi:Lrp/AsnC family leucine-responsive transcriptional regulator
MPTIRRRTAAPTFHIHPLLDDVNVRLLGHLHENARLSITELARRVNMAAPSVTERVRRLEEAGVITGYRVDVNPEALGFSIAAYVRIRPVPGQLPKVAELAQQQSEIVECHRITGEDCFLLKVHVRAVEYLEALLDRFQPFGTTTTSIVQSSPVPLRPLPLPPAARRPSPRRAPTR